MINRVKIIIILIALLLLLISILMPIMSFREWYKWWRENDPNNDYNCFSLTDIAYFQNNVLIFHILNQFGDERRKFKYDFWVYLITGFIMGNAKGLVSGGFVTPKSLCHSLVPDKPPWNGLCYQGKFPQNEWPTDLNDWRSVIAQWGGITFKDDGTTQCYHVGNADGWHSNTDNFLAQWGIAPDSPIVIGFITGWGIYQEAPTYVKALDPLLGHIEGIGSGGWWGFLQNGDDFGGQGLMEINRIVWSTIPQWIEKGQGDSKKCNAEGAVSGGLGGAMIGGMVAGAACGPGAPICMAIGAIIGGVAAGLGSAAASNCL